MDSDTSDRQIQDLESGYQKYTQISSDVPRKKLTPYTPESPLSTAIPWDKVEVFVDGIIMVVIVAVISVIAIFATKSITQRISVNKTYLTYDENLTSDDTVRKPISYTNTPHEYEIAEVVFQQIDTTDQNALILTTGEGTIFIVSKQVEGYLNKEILARGAEYLTKICAEKEFGECLPQIDNIQKVTHEYYESFVIPIDITHNEETISNNAYLLRNRSNSSNLILIASFDKASQKDITTVFEHIKPSR